MSSLTPRKISNRLSFLVTKLQPKIVTSYIVSKSSSHNLSTSLLLLPRELRDVIYAFVLLPPPPAEDNAPKCNNTTRVTPIRGSKRLLYPRRYPSYALLPLLHTCTFLRGETLDFFRRLCHSKSPLADYHLELAGLPAYPETSLLPTWTHLPLPPPFYSSLPALRIDLRILTRDSTTHGFTGSDISISGFRSIFSVINDIIHHGPQFFYDVKFLNRPIPPIDVIHITLSLWNATKHGGGYIQVHDASSDTIEENLRTWTVGFAGTGYLQDSVGKFIIEGAKKAEITVPHFENGDVVGALEWQRAGYRWRTVETRRLKICKCKVGAISGDISHMVQIKDVGHIRVDD
ncbi:hypothetical protein H072_7334 [Dactylellina haptotyla CBS 200.50]|uniref:F-box domain-containing protein n=1 Tax=Dactylellina haptotyla (strain CBS 200.50) TaxID=1284197 RepID=S8ACT9_DACHA|nr:hypothetical protein H072_7334 [Dactylellina haptotyla CBS 200.50]